MPLSRFSRRDLVREIARRGIAAQISGTTVWRWLDEDAIRPWQHRSWVFPRDPRFEEKAGRVLDLYHDREGAFFPLDQVLRPAGIKVIKTPPQSPMCNAYAERFVRETRETLDQLILLGEGPLRQALKKIEHHHNQQRPHQGLDNVIPLDSDYPHQPAPSETVRCDSALGGLLNHYYAERVAA